MNRKKKTPTKKQPSPKEYIVIGKETDSFVIHDIRSMKPIFYEDTDTCKESKESILLQEYDEITFKTKLNSKNNKLTYYTPNNIGMLLSASRKALITSKKLYNENINPDKYNHLLTTDDAKNGINKRSTIIYDFIESVQTSIIFGYTALEAFANLSIPSNYKYESMPDHKGILQIYDKKAIERWLSLQDKISKILVDIYKTKEIKKDSIWNDFLKFEKYRHDIIHQKSIDSTNFYKDYFKKEIFEICTLPEKIIKFFFEERKNKESTNPLWPWINNIPNDLPSTIFNKEDFEVIGTIFE